MLPRDSISARTREELTQIHEALRRFSESAEGRELRKAIEGMENSELLPRFREQMFDLERSPSFRGLIEVFNNYSEKNPQQQREEAPSTKMKKGPGRPRNTLKNAAIDQYVRENKNKPRLPLNAEAFEVKKIERELLEKQLGKKLTHQPISKERDRNLERKINNAFKEAMVQNSD
jgi:hypothetical protein